MNARTGRSAAAVALLLAASGCGNLVSVNGKVTYQGQPVPNTEIKFQPDDGSRPSVGHTDDNGNFSLHYSRQEAGATRGKYTVVLRYVPSNEEELGQAPKASKELLAVIAKYGDPAASPLHYEVTHNGQFIDIKLE
jgi:hypothetical protein